MLTDGSDPTRRIVAPVLADAAPRDLCTDGGIFRSSDPKRCGRACQFAAGGLPLRGTPRWLRPLVARLMPRIGPRGLEFARAGRDEVGRERGPPAPRASAPHALPASRAHLGARQAVRTRTAARGGGSGSSRCGTARLINRRGGSPGGAAPHAPARAAGRCSSPRKAARGARHRAAGSCRAVVPTG